MRVLVTGSHGFIGSHLCRALVDVGDDVHRVDLADSELPVELLREGAFADVMDRVEPEMVVHLAAQVGRIFGERDLMYTITDNATLSTIIGHECGARKVPVLYSSSSEVYGDWGGVEAIEHGELRLPHNLYGLTKRWGEEALRLYAPEGLRIVRLSMPYGPGAPPGVGRRAMDTFLWQAHHRMPITVHKGAERSWCHVSDTVQGIMLVMESAPGVYNIGRDDNPVSMATLARYCCDLTGAPHSLIQMVDAPPRQTVVKRLSTAKLRRLGWAPAVELDAGLDELLAWVRRFDESGNFTG